MKKLNLFFLSIIFSTVLFSQTEAEQRSIENYLSTQKTIWELTSEDVSSFVISDSYKDSKGVSRFYLQQTIDGIKIENAIIGLHFNIDNNVFHSTNRFTEDAKNLVNSSSATISQKKALENSLADLQINNLPKLLKKKSDKQKAVFEKTAELFDSPTVELTYIPSKNGNKLILTHKVYVVPAQGDNYWLYYINADTGAIEKKQSLTLNCEFDTNQYSRPQKSRVLKESPVPSPQAPAPPPPTPLDGSSYRVYAIPTESPNHGPHELITEPGDQLFSPFGWHDINGSPGPEYTITRGNNVHAFNSRADNTTSLGDEPNGGSSLNFDFPYTGSASSQDYLDAATVNLFYMNNIMHDVSARYGFTSASGAFQQNTYGQGGIGGDPVIARVQSGANIGNTNNANMSTPADGGDPTMNMYIWISNGGLVNVTQPSQLVGSYASTGSATGADPWGAEITNTPVTAEVEIIQDAVANPSFTDGCENISNSLNGKIALIDRGGCEFGYKALQAQQAGAVGCIICNFEDGLIGMAPGASGNQVNIPTVFMGKTDCDALRQFAGNGLEISFQDAGAPDTLDSDFDNGVIAHEYAHGISNRLTGGPSAATCLVNDEQMGEGWSDFFAYALTAKSTDSGSMARGIGTYSDGQSVSGVGIRRYPYSTDMSISPLTYGDVASNTAVHAVGEIWADVLWDLFWALTDQYGFDEDIYNGSGGNNLAIELVMEGMKLQPCSPGMLDGRDAIIAADAQLNGGVNKCLIQEVFARRGMGLSASQGSSSSATDQVEAFDTDPLCNPELVIEKTVTEIISAGDVVDVTLVIKNFTGETKNTVIAVDTIPNGLTYVSNSANITSTQNGNKLEFSLGNMAFLDEVTITYQMNSDPTIWSTSFFQDQVDGQSLNKWEPVFDAGGGFYEWVQSIDQSISAPNSWFSTDVAEESRQTIKTINPITIPSGQASLKFWHLFNTEAGFDGGTVDISTDAIQWTSLKDKIFKNPYVGELDYGTFVTPNVSAYYGNSNGWLASYIDLSDYTGQNVYFRFRFGTNDATGGLGWYVDDIELLDLRNYNSGACAYSLDGTTACAMPSERGTLIESNPQSVVSTPKINRELPFILYPNPVDEVLNIQFLETDKMLDISILSVDGRLVEQSTTNTSNNTLSAFDVSGLSPGTYFIQVKTEDSVITEKWVKK